MKCVAEHTEFQVPNKLFKCPLCEADLSIYIFASIDPHCLLHHKGDTLMCEGCGYETDGQSYSIRMKKQIGEEHE